MWTQEMINYLHQNYANTSNKELSKVLDKKSGTIKEYARRQGLKKSENHDGRRIGSFKPLLEETTEAYYWMGFIFADGYISKEGHLQIVSSDDLEHLEIFAKLIGGKVTKNKRSSGWENSKSYFYRVAIRDQVLGVKLRNKMGITGQKTYTGMDMSVLDEDWKVKCFFAGLVDGDGSVRLYSDSKNPSIKIEIHKGSKEVLEFFYEYYGEGVLSDTKDCCVSYTISTKFTRKLYDEIKQYKLPILERKSKLIYKYV